MRDSLKSIKENYDMILSRGKMDNQAVISRSDSYAQAAQENFECNVRGANIVNACENITRLLSEVKQLLILGDFCWLELITKEGAEERNRRRTELDAVAMQLRDEISRDLYALEETLGASSSRRRSPLSQETEDKKLES
ncbi:unnamed protein product [Mesocestoides corti]|uniref:Mediator of RNA polymerase II transcription subunit 22 n=2 Tax=Mesocestoides corti TaxID=53468 RepID=A0A3P6GKR3_MESCO|nr:unnamed protein product [Mesocestoides corti]